MNKRSSIRRLAILAALSKRLTGNRSIPLTAKINSLTLALKPLTIKCTA